MRRLCMPAHVVLALSTACGASPVPATPTAPAWVEEEVSFRFGTADLYGVVTLPAADGSHPALALVSGSASTETGVRSGAASQYHIDHARRLALAGFAVLPDRGHSPGLSTPGYREALSGWLAGLNVQP